MADHVADATRKLQPDEQPENDSMLSNSPTKRKTVKQHSRSPLQHRTGHEPNLRPREPLQRLPPLSSSLSPGAFALYRAQRQLINAEVDRGSYYANRVQDAQAEVRRLAELRELAHSWQ